MPLYSRRRKLLVRPSVAKTLFTALLVLGLCLTSETKPAHAGCVLGDIICEGQQAIQQLIDQYVGPLQLWLQFTIDKMVYQGLYQLELSVASALWSINKALVTVGVGVGLLIGWVSTNFFQPLISTGMQTFGTITSMFFVIALFVLGLCYALAVFIKIEIVSLRSALLWYFAALLFFQVAPSMYSSLDSFRQSLNATFYSASMLAVQGQSPFKALTGGDTTANDPTYGMSMPCNNFPSQIQSPAGSYSGLDVALAYHKADGYDVTGSNGAPCLGNGSVQALPRMWLKPGGYFDPTIAPEMWIAPTFPDTIDTVLKTMQTAVLQAFGGISRLFNALPLIVFGIMEQLTGLCLALAEGLAFISFSAAVMFAFFKRTEPIAWSVVDLIISLIVQTVIIASIQALVVALYLSAAATGSPLVTLAVSVAGLTFMSILLWSGIKAIWNAFNRLFMAFSQATGGAIVTPGAAAQTALAGAALATGVGVAGAGILASGAASGFAGMNALEGGATWAQAAGITLGNNRMLSNAANTLYRLPGLRGSALSEAADQFMEGARLQSLGEDLPLGNVVSPFLGSRLLTDRNPDAVQEDGGQPMLTDTGRAMSMFIRSPRWKRKNDDGLQDASTAEADAREERITDQGVRGEFTPKRPAGGDAPDGDVVGYYDRSGKAIALEEDEDVKRNAELREDLAEARDGDPLRTAQLGADLRLADGVLTLAAANHQSDPIGPAADRLSQAASDWVASSKMNASRADPIGERLGESGYRRQMYEGTFTASGPASVGAVVGDLVSLLAQQRLEAGKSARLNGGENLGNFAVAGAMAQALNLTPTGDKPVIGQDLARYQLYAEQAMRLGLNGEVTEAVATEIGERGGLQPATRDTLRSQVQANTGWSDSRVKAEIRTLENRAGMLPDEVRATGAMPVLIQLDTPQPVPVQPILMPPVASQSPYVPQPVATNTLQRSGVPILRSSQPPPSTPSFASVGDSVEGDLPQRSALPVLRPRAIAGKEGQDA